MSAFGCNSQREVTPMIRINEQHKIDYFAAHNEVAISPEQALLALEDLKQTHACEIDENLGLELICSPPSSWPVAI